MNNLSNTLSSAIDHTLAADLEPIRQFLFTNPSEPLIATGSGGAATAADFAALLYGARGGVATAVSPYTMNSYSDEALRTAKLLLVSKGGHNSDIVFATRRALSVNPEKTAAINFSDTDRNLARKIFVNAGSDKSFHINMSGIHDGFVSSGTSISFYSILTKIFQPDVDLSKYKELPKRPYKLCRNDHSPLTIENYKQVSGYIILHGGWGRPVASNLEGKLVECGLSLAGVYDYRNYCHGRFIYTSNHLSDSAIIMLVTPRERDIANRIRRFLPDETKLIVIETAYDAPEATLDLLIRATAFYGDICDSVYINPQSPGNPGHIDKRVPISIPFKEALKKAGPLCLL